MLRPSSLDELLLDGLLRIHSFDDEFLEELIWAARLDELRAEMHLGVLLPPSFDELRAEAHLGALL